MINIAGLSIELTNAGIQFSGCNTNGVVWDLANNEIQARPDVVAIIAAHDPAKWTTLEQRIATRQAAAKTVAKAIPNWATWTQAEWATYRDGNISTTQINAVTSLAEAKVILNKLAAVVDRLAQMEIALRDQIFPDLPE